MPRTTNAVEWWHRRLNVLVAHAHPSPLTLIRELQKEEHNVAGQILQLIRSGGSQDPGRRRFLEREQRINTLMQAQATISSLEFLERLASRLNE